MALIERLQQTTDATHWRGKIPMNYVYTAGRAGERFFQTLKTQGKFTGTKCEKCDQVYVPPRIFCESCFARLDGEYVTLSDSGVVQTFTICHETYDDQPKKPTIVAAIALDGADTVLMHWLGEVEPEDCFIGMPVEAVFLPLAQRTGSLLDVKYFRPAGA
jgi:uncharacterized OB-fold protein